MVSVKAAATGKVSWGPMVSGLGPLEHPVEQTQTKNTFKIYTSTASNLLHMLKCSAMGYTQRIGEYKQTNDNRKKEYSTIHLKTR